MKNKELKPCPFCGGYATSGENVYRKYQVICRKCLATSITSINENEAIDAWNRRVCDE